MKRNLLILLTLSVASIVQGSTISVSDPQDGGITYKYTVVMSAADSATFSSHVGAWSWEDNALFDENAGEPPVGWTHTSNWVALQLTARAALTVRLERDANVPWPGQADPNRLASTASMYPSFTIFRNWDNDVVPPTFAAKPEVIEAFAPDPVPADLGDWHTYNNRGQIEWAENLVYIAHENNSTIETIERTVILNPGNYSIVIGSNAPATDPNRQGFKATLTTIPALRDDSYFTKDVVNSLSVDAERGVLANDGLSTTGNLVELVSGPARGELVLSPNGSFTYSPGAYFSAIGRDSFAYRVLQEGDIAKPTSTSIVTIGTLRSAGGNYAGLIESDTDATPAGMVNLLVTTAGTWTGTLTHGGVDHRLRGVLAADGTLVLNRPIEGDPILRLLTDENGARLVELQIPTESLTATANQSPYGATSPSPFAGRHELVLTASGASAGAPGGTGSAVLRVKKGGAASITGNLGNGKAFSSASVVVGNGDSGPVIPVFDAIYKGRLGRLSGKLQFGTLATSTPTGALEAVRPAASQGGSSGFSIIYQVAVP